MSRSPVLYRIGGYMEIVGIPPTGIAGSAYSFTLEPANGLSPYTFEGSGLPSGWAVSSGGVVSHAGPSAGSYSLTVLLTDSNRATITKTFTVTIV